MFSAQTSPIAINFGSASVKLLQVTQAGGQKPQVLAAAEIEIPEPMRQEPDRQFLYFSEELPKILRQGRFKGKRVVTAVPTAQTFIQHMQVTPVEGAKLDDLIKAQLQVQMGCSPSGIVVRNIEVADVHRDGQSRKEMICFAAARETVMRYIDLLRRCKLEVVGMHTETLSMVRAFDHLNRRDEDDTVATLYIDLGWGGTRVAITHGRKIVFARYIQIGGRHFDQLVAGTLHCDPATARGHRLALQATKEMRKLTRKHAAQPAGMAILSSALAQSEDAREQRFNADGGEKRVGLVPAELSHEVEAAPAPSQANVDLSELLDTVTDEMSMSLRYHRGLFGGRNVDRVIFLGGEARQVWLCQHVVKTLGLPGQLGDPLARFQFDEKQTTPGFNRTEPQPGWAVPCGLCTTPTDL